MAKERRVIGIAPLSDEANEWLKACPDMGLAIGELVEIAAAERLSPPPAVFSGRGNRIRRSSVRDDVKRFRSEGVRVSAIAKKLDVSRAWIYKILGEK